MTYSFAASPDSKIINDLRVLNEFSLDLVKSLVQLTVATLIDASLPERQILETAQKHQITNVKTIKDTTRALLFFLSQSLKKNLSGESVTADMIKIGVEEKKSEVVGKVWKGTFTRLAQTMKDKTLKVNSLVDLQWKFGVTASTDQLRQVNTCFLQLQLTINTGKEKEDVLMEMTLPQFYKFLQQMEQAERQIASFS
mmetsp:Transcript_13677/g.24700  ORF Transcript_13677/g.24700 Transcript_13677/m.24700 type:complete len:197 (-) Transcript_13677:448-1038(-)|eukprot:CAMPEP_0197519240 /NCGR_PEP_ID=MMETSP1318-20131121/4503_1 /TAXON_ID=552666 /ORGANISM="Partenskyella glossopodia, Strain RCC365" /LENGTH=196 /DNA_ID=CAMNT_0043070103 /DNA_START=91 /DNA_END=681 /DNA_ORIENTATION=-